MRTAALWFALIVGASCAGVGLAMLAHHNTKLITGEIRW
jgi:hypothetical protein